MLVNITSRHHQAPLACKLCYNKLAKEAGVLLACCGCVRCSACSSVPCLTACTLSVPCIAARAFLAVLLANACICSCMYIAIRLRLVRIEASPDDQRKSCVHAQGHRSEAEEVFGHCVKFMTRPPLLMVSLQSRLNLQNVTMQWLCRRGVTAARRRSSSGRPPRSLQARRTLWQSCACMPSQARVGRAPRCGILCHAFI